MHISKFLGLLCDNKYIHIYIKAINSKHDIDRIKASMRYVSLRHLKLVITHNRTSFRLTL